MKLQINIGRERADYFIEVLERGLKEDEGVFKESKPFVKAQIQRLKWFVRSHDDKAKKQAFHTKRFLDGEVEQINLIQDIDIGDFYYIKRCGDEATISYKERELYKFDINKLFGDGYKCRLYVKGELETVVLKFEYEETIGEE